VTRVAVLGAGRMGTPLVERLVSQGHEVRVLGRSAHARERLALTGACVADRIPAATDGADAVLVCVFSDDQVRDVCLRSGLLGGLRAGTAVVVHTTGSPETVKAVAGAAAARGIDVIDAPFSGGPLDIAAGRVTLFVGGAEDAVARVRPLLAAYAEPVQHVGPLGAGQAVKLVNNALFAAQVGLLIDAVRLGAALDVPESILLQALPQGSAASRALSAVAARGSAAGFLGTACEFLIKDVDVIRDVVTALGTDLGALERAVWTLTRPHALRACS
jgi:3-hydroxyisobutyrate dehydrogenase-like beta-hydroxyacid dehydrogenase